MAIVGGDDGLWWGSVVVWEGDSVRVVAVLTCVSRVVRVFESLC